MSMGKLLGQYFTQYFIIHTPILLLQLLSRYNINQRMMLKRKDQFHECLKKNSQTIFQFLQPESILNIAVCSKKYYLLVQPILTVLNLDSSSNRGNNKNQKKQKKNKNKAKLQSNKPEENIVQVDVSNLPFNKSKQNLVNGAWLRIYELPFNNPYLQAKIQSGAVFFYKNSVTNKIIFLNRSLVDPNLNYNRGGFNQDLQDDTKTHMYAEMFEGDLTDVDFTSPEALRKRQKQMLQKIEKKKEEAAKLDIINFDEEFLKGMSCKRIAVILCFGGSFSFGIFEDGKCVLHKSDKKYVCRKKAGQRQLNKDKQSGSQIYSMGSQIRRDQEKKHIANVGQILTENKQAIDKCDLVFLQAPGVNRLFIINDSETLSGVKDRLRSVCLTAKKANYSEVEAIYNQISKVSFVTMRGEAK